MSTPRTESTANSASTVVPDTLPPEGDRAAFMQREAEELISYFDSRPIDAMDAVTIMAVVQTRVCASLGPTRDQSFAGMQEMVAGLYEASKRDFDSPPVEAPAAASSEL